MPTVQTDSPRLPCFGRLFQEAVDDPELLMRTVLVILLLASVGWAQSNTAAVVAFLQKADAHRQKHGGQHPVVLSPKEKLVHSKIDAKAIQASGFPVVVWTVNSRKQMKKLIEQGMSGIISDDAELLMQ